MTRRPAINGSGAGIRAGIIWKMGALICSIFFLSMAMPAWSGAQGAKWELVGFTKYRDAVFVDMNRVSPLPDQRSRVWSRITPAARSRYFRQIRDDLKAAGKAYREFSFIETLNEVDCQGSQIRYWKVIYYTHSGLVIHATRDENPQWKPVRPGSLWEVLKESACRK